MRAFVGFLTFLLLIHCSLGEEARPLELALPTDNDALFHGGGSEFYQYIERDYRGEKSTPWEGGQYGFVRNPVETAAGLTYTRFHEGIDIKPMHRDANGEPLDEVRAIAAGTVVHTNAVPGWSNYGNYIVVEHRWGGSPYYSLYGHLSAIAVQVGDRVARSARLGTMGYTGEGLNRARAHLHLELNLMFSRRFEAWHDASFPNDPNHHGIYNGLNLSGLNIARLFLALQKRPSMTIAEFLADEDTFYKVLVPRSEHFDLLKFYPWMNRSGAGAGGKSWEVAFNKAGVPLRIQSSEQAVAGPVLSDWKRATIDYGYLTRGVLRGSGASASLSESGLRFMQLLTYPD